MTSWRSETTIGLLVMLGFLSACRDNRPKSTSEETPVRQDQEQIIIGRISFLEKNVYRFLRDANDWTLAMRDVPVEQGDVIYSAAEGRSELTIPNETKVRLNDNTKLQLDGLKADLTSVYVKSGTMRMISQGAGTVYKIDTPFGQVLSRQPSTVDVTIGPDSAVVTALDGAARFVDLKERQYDLRPGSNSLLADQNAAVSFRRDRDQNWDDWNNERDNEARRSAENPSPNLPSQLQSESRVLADNGRWEQLTYNGESANYWTPTNVAPDWSPFTVGQWTTWQGEQLWVPYERFGWVTHHYGGWVFHNQRWWWRSPVLVSGWRYPPWYPARVVWVNHGHYVGWVPCGWHEVCYGRRYWGPRTVVLRENVHIRDVDLRRYANINRAVIVDKERFYSPHARYEYVKDAKVVTDVVHSGHTEHVLTRDTLRGTNSSMEHHFARSGDFSQKPQAVAFTRPQGSFGHSGENAKALGDRIAKANAVNPAPRTNQPLPFAEQKAEGNRRELSRLPQDHQSGRGQHLDAAVKGQPGPKPQAQDQLQAQKHNQQLQQQRQQAMQQRQQQQQQLQAQRQQQLQAQRQQQVERQQAIQQQNQQQRLAQQQARQQQLQQLQQQKQAVHQQNQAQQQLQHQNQQGKHQREGN
jgi:hypothetical protein